jgi:hypothetical protein
VLVEVGRDRDRRVPQAVTHRLERCAGRIGQRRAGVTLVVEADVRQSSTAQRLLETPAERVARDRRAGRTREDQPQVGVVAPKRLAFDLLTIVLAVQRVYRMGGQCYPPPAPRRLGGAEDRRTVPLRAQ